MVGTFDMSWANHLSPSETPKYVLHFVHSGTKQGGQRTKNIVGDDALESYLQMLGTQEPDAKSWIQRLCAEQSVFIDNFNMPEGHAVAYAN